MEVVRIDTFVVGSLQTNCYLVYSKAQKVGFLIDPGSFDKRILDSIRKGGIHIKNIINTHGHSDHTSGNRKFGYPVLIHEYDSGFLKDPVKNLTFFTQSVGRGSGGVTSSSPPASKFLKGGDCIEEGELVLEVIHTPGHTPGSISLKLGNIIFTGDTLFREGVGRTDIPCANEKDLQSSIKNRLMVFPDDVEILPGHGPRSTIGHERKNNPFL